MGEKKLRDYQKNQIEFLNKHLDKKSNNLFNSNIALESPTGSGKSFMLLSFIKEYFASHRNKKIFIATGFNSLIPQFYSAALEEGIPTQILAGRNKVNCIKKINSSLPEEKRFGQTDRRTRTFVLFEDAYDVPKAEDAFTLNDLTFKVKANECYRCDDRDNPNCLYNKAKARIDKPGNLLVITNHSTLLANQELFRDKFIGGFIDECQAFGDFYESYMRIEVPANAFKTILNTLLNDNSPKNKNQYAKLLANGINRGEISKQFLRKILEAEIFTEKGLVSIEKMYGDWGKQIRQYLEINPSAEDVFVHPMSEDGRFQGILVDRFSDKFNLGKPICIVSATVDSYTKDLFTIKDSYKERGCVLFNYNDSTFYIYKSLGSDIYSLSEQIEKFVSKQTEDRGLFFSTRLDIVEYFKNKEKICDYEVITNCEDFRDNAKQILIGSKSISQGIDIQGVKFILINKIPFPRYDASYKKKQKYLNNRGYDNPYSQFTIPSTENALLQITGRLWRHPGDKGDIAIFDDRLNDKHKGILYNLLSYREGLKISNVS